MPCGAPGCWWVACPPPQRRWPNSGRATPPPPPPPAPGGLLWAPLAAALLSIAAGPSRQQLQAREAAVAARAEERARIELLRRLPVTPTESAEWCAGRRAGRGVAHACAGQLHCSRARGALCDGPSAWEDAQGRGGCASAAAPAGDGAHTSGQHTTPHTTGACAQGQPPQLGDVAALRGAFPAEAEPGDVAGTG